MRPGMSIRLRNGYGLSDSNDLHHGKFSRSDPNLDGRMELKLCKTRDGGFLSRSDHIDNDP